MKQFVIILIIVVFIVPFGLFMKMGLEMKVDEDPTFRFSYIDDEEAIEMIRQKDEENKLHFLYGQDETEIFDSFLYLGYIKSVRYIRNTKFSSDGEITGLSTPDKLRINTSDNTELENLNAAMEILLMILTDYDNYDFNRVNVEIIGTMGVLSENSIASLPALNDWYKDIIEDDSLTRDEKVSQMADIWIEKTGYVGLISPYEYITRPTLEDEVLNNSRFERDSVYYIFKRYQEEYDSPRFKSKYMLYRIERNDEGIELNYSPKYTDVYVDFNLPNDYAINFPAKDRLTGITGMVDYYINYVSKRTDYPNTINYLTLEIKDAVGDEKHEDEVYFIPMSVFETVIVEDVSTEAEYQAYAKEIIDNYLEASVEVYFTKYLIQ